MPLLSEDEFLEFERACDVEGMSAEERLQIVRDVFGKTEARLYEERRCKVLTFQCQKKSGFEREAPSPGRYLKQ